jgi:uncharacterized repeat protein (TIGR03803 family)
MLLRSWMFGGMAIISSAQTLTTLVSFNLHNGGYPIGPLAQGIDGNFYGTTSDEGTVFKITPGGTLTTLHSFTGGTDGGGPYAGLVQATDGNFYGTTVSGGSTGHGTVFKITPGGTLTTLYSFGSQATDGQNPYGQLVQATDGNFYGTTKVGGTNGQGTVFKITPGETLTTPSPPRHRPSRRPSSSSAEGLTSSQPTEMEACSDRPACIRA